MARDVADVGVPDTTLEDLRGEWSASGFELSRDAIVGLADGEQIVAYAVVRLPGSVAVVHPAHEGNGYGRTLLDWVERREAEIGWKDHRQAVASTNEAGALLLRQAGYERERSYWRMTIDLAGLAEPPPRAPLGTRLRPVDRGADAALLHALDDASFSGLPDYRPHTLHEFVEHHLENHDFDRDCSMIAERDGAAAAFLLARRWVQEGTGFVDILAVHPGHQRRGIGSTMLRHAFARFREAGLSRAELGVASDNPRALELYERVGMRPRFRFDVYARPVVD